MREWANGGTGRRVGLKIQWLQDCESSSLSSPTKLTMNYNNNNFEIISSRKLQPKNNS